MTSKSGEKKATEGRDQDRERWSAQRKAGIVLRLLQGKDLKEVSEVSCYEAVRDGFWVHRFLVSQGIESHVMDSSSTEVSLRRRHRKSDELDLKSLLRLPAGHVGGVSQTCGGRSGCRAARPRTEGTCIGRLRS